jgi:Tfp pilus assembly protein FimT
MRNAFADRFPIARVRRPSGRRSRDAGFTLIELMFWAAVSVAVIAAGVAAYVGTSRSWRGTESLARIQRECCLAMEIMTHGIREGTRVDVERADSVNVYYSLGSSDSLVAAYFLDDENRLVDQNGVVLVSDVDSLHFGSADGKVTDIDIHLRDTMGTPDVASDDQTVLMSSSAVCRN